MPQRQPRNKRRADSDSAHAPALATLASLASCKRHHRHLDTSLSVYSLAASQGSGGGRNSSSSSSATLPSTAQLTFDPKTRLPPPDIVEELLSHMDQEFNIISKIVQPKKLLAAHQHGGVCTFLLLAVLANNALFSEHPAIVSIGTVPAVRALVDRAKVFVPDALETPSVTCCQAVLLLSVAYMHLGMLDVSSHYSSMSLRILQQLGVYKIDDSAWADGDEWISESWLEREQIRRLIWGSFTIDTFLALMLHTPPFVLVDLSGVNRPCSQSVWYIGNDNLEALSYPDNTVCAKPGDSEYLKTLKKLKLAGMPWQSNGTTLQLNFSVLGNVILRGISDPQFSQDVLDRLVLRAFCSLAEWIALVPPMPEAPSYDEVHYTLLISSVALCLKSVITPYLIARVTDKQPNSISGGDGGSSSSDGDGNGSGSGSGSGNGNDGESPLIAAARATARYSEKAYNLPIPPPGARLDQELALEWMLKDYISTSCQVYRFMRHTHDMMTSNIVPPMFAAQTAMISGGIFAACAHSAPSESQRARFAMFRDYVMATCRTHSAKSLLFNISLTEIKRVDEMVRFMPRRLEAAQLKAIRSTIIPDSVESLVNKRFSAFVHSLRALTRLPMAPGSPESDTTSSSCPGTGNIPLTSNLCAIFGRLVKSSSSSCAEAKNRLFRDEKLGGGIDAYTSGSPSAAIPNYKLTYIAISSLMVALSLASKDESFLDFVPELRASSANGLPTTSTSQQQQQHRHQRPGTPTFSSSSLGQSQQRSKDLPVYSNGVGNSCTTATAFAWSLASRVCSSMAPQNAKQPEQQKQNTMPPPMSPNSVRSAPTPPPPTLALSPLSSDNSRPASQKPPSKPSNLVDLLN